MPCPVVHPLPSLVPKPTKNPPTMNPSGETIGIVASPYPRRASVSASGSISVTYTLAVNANAAKKLSFHCCAGSVNVLTGATMNELIRPEAPRISPLKRSRVAADRPISEPPINPEMGVKY